MRSHFCCFVLLCMLSACAPNSLEDFQQEGQSLARQLATELQNVQTREDLQKASPKLKKRFDQLVALMIEARKFQQAHSEESSAFDLYSTDPATSDMLLCELKRVYRIESGREIIEKAQKESLIKLDAFERGLVKQQQRIKK